MHAREIDALHRHVSISAKKSKRKREEEKERWREEEAAIQGLVPLAFSFLF